MKNSLNDNSSPLESNTVRSSIAAEVTAIRQFCEETLSDIPLGERVATLARLGALRRASDRPALRTALFDVLSRHLGSQTAQARIGELDRRFVPREYSGRRG